MKILNADVRASLDTRPNHDNPLGQACYRARVELEGDMGLQYVGGALARTPESALQDAFDDAARQLVAEVRMGLTLTLAVDF